MPGVRNPLNVANVFEEIHDAVDKVKFKSRGTSAKKVVPENLHYVDLYIQFIGASGLPKMDVVGSADPYFVAKLDDKISFVSTVKADTLTPVWNEWWVVRNVPENATLGVEVMDKDDDTVTDDYIGRFSTEIAPPGAKEIDIEGPILRHSRGKMWLKIDSTPSTSSDPQSHPYIFDGPIRFSRHFSPTVGLLTNSDMRLYSTWKFFIKGVPLYFGDSVQPWNRNYKAAQNIFQGPTSIAVRSGIQAGHRMLYARSTTNGFGVIDNPHDVFSILRGGAGRAGSPPHAHRVKPAVYTYIISADDDSFRFSETGAAFFVDFASKHALHSNCAEAVRYSGEFHPRPAGGWEDFSDAVEDADVRWELVIDNNSGTYAPDAKVLPDLQALLKYNFPGFGIFALSREDPELTKSREACRAYALKYRGVHQDDLQPHAGKGEVTLSSQAVQAGVAQAEGSATDTPD